mmetsp:Transcript_12018/g.17912  ORF Transcript_12018/g.17912 Transcript_12018/m.17912 type:complete len:204 (+) Transcript_12018:294-905(+)
MRPAVALALKYSISTNITDAKTVITPGTAVPRRFSTLLIVFHVSPMLKCNSIANNGALMSEYPIVLYTTADAAALRIAIIDQTMGKVIGGGIQEGVLRSSTSFRSGRELSITENTRLRTERNRNMSPTTYGGSVMTELIRARVAAIIPNCAPVARTYRLIAALSSFIPPALPSAETVFGLNAETTCFILLKEDGLAVTSRLRL